LRYIKEIMNDWLPPVVMRVLLKLYRKKGRPHFTGEYESWAEATNNAIGYDDPEILRKVLESTLKVKDCEFAYARDGVVFEKVEYSWELLTGLMLCAVKNKGKLSVLDVGGGLGTTYFQNKIFLENIDEVKWSIVEQAHYVDAGEKYFQDDVLKFYGSVESCLCIQTPNVAIISASMQYMPNQKSFLETIISTEIDILIIDRTFVQQTNSNKIYVQHIGGDYPCFSISESWLIKTLEEKYKLIVDFDSLPFSELETIDSEFKGYIFMKVDYA
jgi:putative methyltransferase (TIGR04325 family)